MHCQSQCHSMLIGTKFWNPLFKKRQKIQRNIFNEIYQTFDYFCLLKIGPRRGSNMGASQ